MGTICNVWLILQMLLLREYLVYKNVYPEFGVIKLFVKSSLSPSYTFVIPSLNLRYASVMPSLNLRYAFASLT